MSDKAANRASSPIPGQVALYRFYDAREHLLYAGISNEPWRRRKEHSVTQPWYPQVRHQAITWYDSEAEAYAAEQRAIREEQPEFNIAGAVRPARGRLVIRPVRWVSVGTWIMMAYLAILAAVLLAPPPFRPVLAAISVATSFTGLTILFIAILLLAAPLIARFGAWIERNSLYPSAGDTQ
jgi:hypothetical protein